MGLDALDEVGDADVVRGQSEGCADLDEFGFALAEERAGENAVGVLSGCGWMDWARAAGGGGDDVRGICGGDGGGGDSRHGGVLLLRAGAGLYGRPVRQKRGGGGGGQ